MILIRSISSASLMAPLEMKKINLNGQDMAEISRKADNGELEHKAQFT